MRSPGTGGRLPARPSQRAQNIGIATLPLPGRQRRQAALPRGGRHLGSESSHVRGTSTSSSAYTRRSKEQGSSMRGRKVTLAVIWRMIAAGPKAKKGGGVMEARRFMASAVVARCRG